MSPQFTDESVEFPLHLRSPDHFQRVARAVRTADSQRRMSAVPPKAPSLGDQIAFQDLKVSPDILMAGGGDRWGVLGWDAGFAWSQLPDLIPDADHSRVEPGTQIAVGSCRVVSGLSDPVEIRRQIQGHPLWLDHVSAVFAERADKEAQLKDDVVSRGL